MRKAYRRRRIDRPPDFKNFKPSGIPRRELETVTLNLDEFEALRLADYLGLEQIQAAEEMGISRPTFTRLIEKARYKITKAILEGMELVIDGGNVEFAHTKHRCLDCGDERINTPDVVVDDCPECGSSNVEDTVKNFINSDVSPK
ncbi:MAG: DUF134 domain-containing protein [Calditrichaceae bacterium]